VWGGGEGGEGGGREGERGREREGEREREGDIFLAHVDLLQELLTKFNTQELNGLVIRTNDR
jgi:hypothetical protein